MHGPDAVEPIEASSFVRLRRACYVLSGIVFVAVALALLTFGRLGAPFVNALDEQLPQVAFARAVSLNDSGQPQAAISTLTKALESPYGSKTHKTWICRRLGDIHYDLAQWDLAAQAYENALKLNPRQVEAYGRLCAAYRNAGRTEKLLDAAERWKAAAQGVSEDQVKAAQAAIDRLKAAG